MASSPRPSSPYSGPRPTNPKPHSDWTAKRVPLTRPPVDESPLPFERTGDDVADFERFCAAIFDQSRDYVAADRNVALHTMRVLAVAICSVDDERRRAVLLHHAERLERAGRERLALDDDRKLLTRRLERLRSVSCDPQTRAELLEERGWCGGSA